MTNSIEFPGLGLTLELDRVAFSIGGIDIYWYGIVIGIGMVLAVLFAFSQATRFGIDADRMVDVIIIGFVFAIVGGRLYYVLFGDIKYENLWQMIDLRSGGIAIYGAIIGAFLGGWLGCRWRKVPVLPLFDLTAMGFLIGQSIGRWGNFFNQEAFGTNTTLPWGMRSPTTIYYLEVMKDKLADQGMIVDPNMPVHPTFLYESLWCALGFLLLFLYRKHRKFNGEIALFYMIWYGAGRALIEGLRTDSLFIPGVGLRVSQVLGIASAVAGLVIWIVARKKNAGKPLQVPEIPPHTAKVTVYTETGAVETVTISWPATDRPPTKDQQQELARQVLEAGKADGKDAANTDEAEPDAADEQTADNNADEADAPETGTDDKPAEALNTEADADITELDTSEMAEDAKTEDAADAEEKQDGRDKA